MRERKQERERERERERRRGCFRSEIQAVTGTKRNSLTKELE
jgi:hypothetical protein